jgi:integrase
MFPRRDRPENLTVEQWVRRWYEQIKPRWGSAMAYDVGTMINRHIIPGLGARLLRELTFEDIGRFTGMLRQCPGVRGRSMGAERINKILKILKRALQDAVGMGVLVRSPMSSWQALRTPKPEMRPFTKDEFRALLGALPQEWQAYFEFAVWTGLRPGEQAALRWSEVDLKSIRPVVEVRASMDSRKSGSRHSPKTPESARAVELVPQAVAALQAQRLRMGLSSLWVFPGPKGGPLNVSNLRRRVYYPALRRAELIERGLNTCRHTFAVFMLESGENPGWVARQMGHVSTEMLWRRYARWWPQVARSDGSRVRQWWGERI